MNTYEYWGKCLIQDKFKTLKAKNLENSDQMVNESIGELLNFFNSCPRGKPDKRGIGDKFYLSVEVRSKSEPRGWQGTKSKRLPYSSSFLQGRTPKGDPKKNTMSRHCLLLMPTLLLFLPMSWCRRCCWLLRSSRAIDSGVVVVVCSLKSDDGGAADGFLYGTQSERAYAWRKSGG